MTKAELIQLSTTTEGKQLYRIREEMEKTGLASLRILTYSVPLWVTPNFTDEERTNADSDLADIKTTLEGEGYTVTKETIEVTSSPLRERIDLTVEW